MKLFKIVNKFNKLDMTGCHKQRYKFITLLYLIEKKNIFLKNYFFSLDFEWLYQLSWF